MRASGLHSSKSASNDRADRKHGWLGDALDASDEGFFNFGMESVHRAFVRLIADSQHENGDLPAAVPSSGSDSAWVGNASATAPCGDIAWGAAFPLIALRLHTYYNDSRTASAHWPALVRYAEHLIAVASRPSCAPYDRRQSPVKSCKPTSWNGLAVCDQFGDWLAPHIGCAHGCPCSGKPQFSTCPVPEVMAGYSYVMILRAMAALARFVRVPAGNGGDAPLRPTVAARYADLAANATDAFHGTFFNGRLHQYGGDDGALQSLNVPALALGAAQQHGVASDVLGALQHNLKNETGYHLRVGAVVSKLLLGTLSENGLHAAALNVATREDEPSWGYWLSQNATSCWEAWPGATDGSTSRNHIFLCGGFGEWLWQSVVGLRPTAPGFAEVSVAPQIGPPTTTSDGGGISPGPASVAGTLRAARGVISVAWNVSHARDCVWLTVDLPLGVRRGRVTVPAPFTNGQQASAEHCVVTEGGKPVWDGTSAFPLPAGITDAKNVSNGVELELSGNGRFEFESRIARLKNDDALVESRTGDPRVELDNGQGATPPLGFVSARIYITEWHF